MNSIRQRQLAEFNRETIPKGFRPPAQGWRFLANPGKQHGKRFNPNGVASTTGLARTSKTDTTLSGLQPISLFTQGWLNNANPGLED